jgi:hypothetical protein
MKFSQLSDPEYKAEEAVDPKGAYKTPVALRSFCPVVCCLNLLTAHLNLSNDIRKFWPCQEGANRSSYLR